MEIHDSKETASPRKKLVENHLPHIRFHDLRHGCASVLIAMKWSLKDVQQWLGRADIQMTANIYSQLDVVRKTNIAASLETKFGTASGR